MEGNFSDFQYLRRYRCEKFNVDKCSNPLLAINIISVLVIQESVGHT